MNIIWDEAKNKKLQAERGISFEEIASLILQKEYVDIVAHTKHPHQKIFILPLRGYIHAVPFVIDDEKNIVLKTAFPSRKFNKIYGQKNTKTQT